MENALAGRDNLQRYEIFIEMMAQAQHQDKLELRQLYPTVHVTKLTSADSLLQHYPIVLQQLEITLNDRELKIVRMPEAIFCFGGV